VWLRTHLPLIERADISMDAAPQRDTTRFTRAGEVAIIDVAGPITKHLSFWSFLFGGASTEETKRAVRDAMADDQVSSLLLRVDSPGGHVAGVQDLADVLFEARATKRVYAHIEDLGASAAYWLASQAHRITANATAEIGSIGTLAVIEDWSEFAAQEGVTVHVVTSQGAEAHKGMGVPGTAITAAHLADIQRRVDAVNAHFLQSIARGRKLAMTRVRSLADGRMHDAAVAQDLGLIDGVMSFEAALAQILRSIQSRSRAKALLRNANGNGRTPA
jgi:signal peptide peptidase SppA